MYTWRHLLLVCRNRTIKIPKGLNKTILQLQRQFWSTNRNIRIFFYFFILCIFFLAIQICCPNFLPPLSPQVALNYLQAGQNQENHDPESHIGVSFITDGIGFFKMMVLRITIKFLVISFGLLVGRQKKIECYGEKWWTLISKKTQKMPKASSLIATA